MNTKYTPAPLQFRNGIIEESPISTQSVKGRRTIGSVNTFGLSDTEHYYYGKLFAAAPELLEALQELMNVYEQNGQLLSFDVNIAKQAIKKATK